MVADKSQPVASRKRVERFFIEEIEIQMLRCGRWGEKDINKNWAEMIFCAT